MSSSASSTWKAVSFDLQLFQPAMIIDRIDPWRSCGRTSLILTPNDGAGAQIARKFKKPLKAAYSASGLSLGQLLRHCNDKHFSTVVTLLADITNKANMTNQIQHKEVNRALEASKKSYLCTQAEGAPLQMR